MVLFEFLMCKLNRENSLSICKYSCLQQKNYLNVQLCILFKKNSASSKYVKNGPTYQIMPLLDYGLTESVSKDPWTVWVSTPVSPWRHSPQLEITSHVDNKGTAGIALKKEINQFNQCKATSVYSLKCFSNHGTEVTNKQLTMINPMITTCDMTLTWHVSCPPSGYPAQTMLSVIWELL